MYSKETTCSKRQGLYMENCVVKIQPSHCATGEIKPTHLNSYMHHPSRVNVVRIKTNTNLQRLAPNTGQECRLLVQLFLSTENLWAPSLPWTPAASTWRLANPRGTRLQALAHVSPQPESRPAHVPQTILGLPLRRKRASVLPRKGFLWSKVMFTEVLSPEHTHGTCVINWGDE